MALVILSYGICLSLHFIFRAGFCAVRRIRREVKGGGREITHPEALNRFQDTRQVSALRNRSGVH